MATRFSRYFKVSPNDLKKEGLLNSFLDRDSRFYIHPIQLRNTKNSFLQTGYANINKAFVRFSRLISSIQKYNNTDSSYREIQRVFDFPEPPGLCIGYSEESTDGTGLRGKLAQRIIDTAHQITRKMKLDPEIFEILPFIEEGVGADRLSDMLSNLLEEDLALLTENIAKKYKIKKVKEVEIGKGKYKLPWFEEKQRHILLLPKDILSRLPQANTYEEITELVQHNERLRDLYNEMWRSAERDKRKLAKPDVKTHIKNILIKDVTIFADLLEAYRKAQRKGYDFDADPDNEFRWDDLIESLYFAKPAKTTPKSQSVKDIITYLIGRFKEYSEKQKLSMVFYSGKDRLKEHFPQQVFKSLAQLYIDDKNVDISPECNLGPGQVDFKFSRGSEKVLIEMKLLSNTAWREGLTKQLTAYYDAEKPQKAFYMVFYIGNANNKLKLLNADLKNLHKTYDIEIVTINANKQVSASKRR